jgi:hypothetical protein
MAVVFHWKLQASFSFPLLGSLLINCFFESINVPEKISNSFVTLRVDQDHLSSPSSAPRFFPVTFTPA